MGNACSAPTSAARERDTRPQPPVRHRFTSVVDNSASKTQTDEELVRGLDGKLMSVTPESSVPSTSSNPSPATQLSERTGSAYVHLPCPPEAHKVEAQFNGLLSCSYGPEFKSPMSSAGLRSPMSSASHLGGTLDGMSGSSQPEDTVAPPGWLQQGSFQIQHMTPAALRAAMEAHGTPASGTLTRSGSSSDAPKEMPLPLHSGSTSRASSGVFDPNSGHIGQADRNMLRESMNEASSQ